MQIARDNATGFSKGHGFISFDSFTAADAAIEAMNGQFLMNRCITVSYAMKKDGNGERHGTAAGKLDLCRTFAGCSSSQVKKCQYRAFHFPICL